MQKVFICDLDGTVANLSHRLHLITGKCKDWPAFFAACPGDTVMPDVAKVIRILADAGQKIVYITGRSNVVHEQTLTWLLENGLPDGPIYMRKDGDHRPDNIVKSELLDCVLKNTPLEHIAGAFEDRNQVVEMYRQRGLTVFQVADGNF